MAKKKKKESPLVKYSRGIPIEPSLVKARSIRNNLLGRCKSDEMKLTTPSIKDLHRWLNIPDYMCFYCLKPLTLETINIDHKTPIGRNGQNEITNLCVSCEPCNRIKGNLKEDEFRQLLELLKTWEEIARDVVLTRLKMGHFGK